MLAMLLAYDADGNVVATLDAMVAQDAHGTVYGLIDFAAHEEAGGKLRDIWDSQLLDGPIPDDIRAEMAAATGLPPDQVTALPARHPWRIAHDTVKGSGTWPEWIGGHAHHFRVVLDPDKRISALVHQVSGHRRERATVEAAIASRIADAGDEPADIRDLVGGPNAHLPLDQHGRTLGRALISSGTPAHLPILDGPK